MNLEVLYLCFTMGKVFIKRVNTVGPDLVPPPTVK